MRAVIRVALVGSLFGLALGTFSPGRFLGAAAAQEKKQAKGRYPRVNLATWYEVDAVWPQKPDNVAWGDMPGIAVDDKDHVWLFTRAKPPVQVYDSSGQFIRAWGDDVVGRAHQIKFDSQGNVWLADMGHHVVMQLTTDGKLLKTLGTKGKSGCDETHLNQPTDMAITRDGDVFVSDGYGNDRIVHFDKNGKFVKEWGKLGVGPGEFSCPHAIVLDSKGRLYVADRNNARVQVFDQSGKFLSEWRDLIVPWGFWLTPADEIWVCGSSPMPWRWFDTMLGCPPKDQVFMKFNPDGRLLQLWTVSKGKDREELPGECNWVHCVAADSKGNLYAGDIIGKRAQKFIKHEQKKE